MSKFVHNRRALARIMVIAVAISLLGSIAFFGMPVEVVAEEESYNYIYFDLSAGNITISGTSYTGYRYDGRSTPTAITGTLQNGEAYYVYQSNGNINTGVIDGVWTPPTPLARVTHEGQAWADYITDNTNVNAVISAWNTDAAAAGRKATPNRIHVTGQVGNTVMVVDNIWSSYVHTNNTSRNTAAISFLPGSVRNSNLTVRYKGDNRACAIHYTSSMYQTVDGMPIPDNRLILEGFTNEDSFTVADLSTTSKTNYWCSAIGGSDNTSYENSMGIVINGGTLWAGTTTGDDCTAIGGGGNGYGVVAINGGRVTAVVTSSGAAIGGGIGKTANGGQAAITITGGEVYAYNNSCVSGYSLKGVPYIPAAAIGGGSSARSICNPCIVKITGGTVYAQSVGGTAIGGGSSADTNGGSATVTIGGDAVVYAKSIAGKIGGYNVPAGVAIGGGTGGAAGNGGSVTLHVSDTAVLRTGSIGGGATIGSGAGYKIGHAVIDITGGDISGQFIMAEGSSSNCELVMSGGVIDNSHKTNDFVFKETNGGAIYMDDSAGVANVSGGEIVNCSALNGGAVYMTAGTFTLSGTAKILNCTATENGGAVYLGGGALNIEGGSINSNRAQNGAGAYLGGGTLTMSGGSMAENTATQNGGGAYLANGQLNISGGEVKSNTAQNGAGAYLASGTLTMSDGAIRHNVAAQNGGGTYLGGGSMSVSGGEVKNNSAQNGGGTYVSGGSLALTGGSLQNNTVSKDGGGAYVSGGSLNVSGDAVVQNNSAQNGGGAYVSGGSLNLTGGYLQNNTVSKDGGGAYVSGGDVDVKNGTIAHNVAENNGGGIAVLNGSYRMVGGSIDYNLAKNGQGGGVYITADGKDVLVDVRSGSISYNKAGIQGGAISVSTDRSSTDHIEVNIGVNEHHLIEGEDVYADHDEDGTNEHNGCPLMQLNEAPVQAGAIFVKGGVNTFLNVYCLCETESAVTETEDSKSVFMKVEGGTVRFSTAKDGDSETVCGFIRIENAVHITAGDLYLEGMMSNPMFLEDITVDVIQGQGGLHDNRPRGEGFFVLIYFENFKDSGTSTHSGQYTLTQYPEGSMTYISGVVYQHSGYTLKGWNTLQNGTGNTYPVSAPCVFDGTWEVVDGVYHIGDLVIYAVWETNGYFIDFLPNPLRQGDVVEGEMPRATAVYDVAYTLPKCAFLYQGYVFVGWVDQNGTTYADGATVYKLSEQSGTVIEFKAMWTECTHQHSEVVFTYSATNNLLTRTCSCRGYTQSVAVNAVGATYDGSPHGATLPLVITKNSTNSYSPDLAWSPTVGYEGVNLLEYDVPVNAGEYYATVSDGGATARILYIIRKATQEAPGVPTFTVNEAATPREITVVPNEEDGKQSWQHYEYRLTYLAGDELVDTPWSLDEVQRLDHLYITYFVYIRYGETMNYLASVEVVAENVYYYDENIDIRVHFGVGLKGWISFGESISGVDIIVLPEEGYYRSNVTIVLTTEDEEGNSVDGMTIVSVSDGLYNLNDIPSGIQFSIYIDINGAKPITQTESSIMGDQIFGDFSDSSAGIGRDSSFTVRYEIKDYYGYTDLRLRFSKSDLSAVSLPVGTTIILMDLNDGSYWYYRATAATQTVKITDFTRMGGTEKHSAPSDSELRYQFVVSFEQVDGGFQAADQLNVTITATADSLAEPEISTFAEQTASVELHDVRFVIAQESVVGLDCSLTVEFAYSEASALAKWNYRSAALVIEPTVPLPKDAHIEVVEHSNTFIRRATYYLNSEGVFVVSVSRGLTSLSIFLKGDLDSDAAEQGAEYLMDAKLYGSYSRVSQSPLNGELMAEETGIRLTRAATETVALSITSNQTTCVPDGVLTVQVDYRFPENYSISMRLLRKSDQPDESGYISGEYGDTGFAESNVMDGLNWTQIPTVEYRGELRVSLGGQTQGSYCLVITIHDDTGVAVKNVSYYFLIVNPH